MVFLPYREIFSRNIGNMRRKNDNDKVEKTQNRDRNIVSEHALKLPPLRDRREDLPVLAKTFIARACAEHRMPPCTMSSALLEALERYAWPGNVRELENAMERAVLLADRQNPITVTNLPPEVRSAGAGKAHPSAKAPEGGSILPLSEVERRHILDVLERFDGNRKATAEALGIGETTLWRRLKGYGLVRERGSKA